MWNRVPISSFWLQSLFSKHLEENISPATPTYPTLCVLDFCQKAADCKHFLVFLDFLSDSICWCAWFYDQSCAGFITTGTVITFGNQGVCCLLLRSFFLKIALAAQNLCVVTSFCATKKEWRDFSEWKRVFASHAYDEGFIAQTYKSSNNSTCRTQTAIRHPCDSLNL